MPPSSGPRARTNPAGTTSSARRARPSRSSGACRKACRSGHHAGAEPLIATASSLRAMLATAMAGRIVNVQIEFSGAVEDGGQVDTLASLYGELLGMTIRL